MSAASHDDITLVVCVCVVVLLLMCCKNVGMFLMDLWSGVDVCMGNCPAIDTCCVGGSVRFFVFVVAILQPVLVSLTPLLVRSVHGDTSSVQPVCLYEIHFNNTSPSALHALTQLSHACSEVDVDLKCFSSVMLMVPFAVTSAVAVSLWWNVNQHICNDPLWDDDICADKGVMVYELMYVVELFARNLAILAVSALPMQLHAVVFMAACTTFIMMYFLVIARSEVHYDNFANSLIVIVIVTFFVNIWIFHATSLVDASRPLALVVASVGIFVSLADVLFHFMCAGACNTSLVIMTRCVLSSIFTYAYVIASLA